MDSEAIGRRNLELYSQLLAISQMMHSVFSWLPATVLSHCGQNECPEYLSIGVMTAKVSISNFIIESTDMIEKCVDVQHKSAEEMDEILAMKHLQRIIISFTSIAGALMMPPLAFANSSTMMSSLALYMHTGQMPLTRFMKPIETLSIADIIKEAHEGSEGKGGTAGTGRRGGGRAS